MNRPWLDVISSPWPCVTLTYVKFANNAEMVTQSTERETSDWDEQAE